MRRQNQEVSLRGWEQGRCRSSSRVVRQPQAEPSPSSSTLPRVSVLPQTDMSPSDKPTLLSLAFKPLPTPQHLAMHRAGTEQREEELDPLAQSEDAPILQPACFPLAPTTLSTCPVSTDG